MANKNSQKRSPWFICIGAALLCLIVAFTLVMGFYFKKFDQTLAQENETHLAETSGQTTAHMHSIMEDTTASLQIISDALSTIQGRDERLAYLAKAETRTGFSYLGYADKNGILYPTNQFEPETISDESYFQAALKGKTQISNPRRKIMEDKVLSGVILSVPIYSKSGQPSGCLAGMLDMKQLKSVLNISSFNGQGYIYLIDPNGELVLHTRSMAYNNFYLMLQNAQFKEGSSYEQAKNAISAGQRGMIMYNNLGTDQYAYFQPLGINDWTIINIVAKNAVTAKTAALTKELGILSIASIIVFLLLLAIAVITFALSENRRRATEMKSAFLANMSHELRTPMNAIIGISELLQREELTDKQQDYVRIINSSGTGLLTIINDILDFSKIEAGKFVLVDEAYSLRSLIIDITTLVSVRIGDKPIHFFVDVDASVPASLIGDSTRVKQILINLLSNAAKFTEKGSIRLILRSVAVDDRIQLTMTVTDTGIGIRKQDMGHLFTSFNQLDSHKNHNMEGTGLGLAISKYLSELMGGGIAVESTYGTGSAFTAVIYQQPSDSSAPLLQTIWPQNKKLAVYEPQDIPANFYQECLNRFGVPHQIFRELDALEDSIDKEGFHFILADTAILKQLPKAGKEGALVHIPLREQHVLDAPDHQWRHSVYAPLFCLEIFPAAYADDESYDAPLRTSFDALSVDPMPEAKVLLVDDNEINLQIAEALMEPYCMTVDCVFSGQEALDLVKKRDYNIIFMDHMMPDMDGVETMKCIRALPDEKYRSLPIVVLTANATREAQLMFMAEGFDAFLAKPMDIEKLDAVLRKYGKT